MSSFLLQTPTFLTTRRCLTSLSWWKGNRFMHIKFCCLQLHPGEELPIDISPPHIFSCNIQAIPSVSSRFKSLLQNRPAAENTCIEISHVKYNIFHVRPSLFFFPPVITLKLRIHYNIKKIQDAVSFNYQLTMLDI